MPLLVKQHIRIQEAFVNQFGDLCIKTPNAIGLPIHRHHKTYVIFRFLVTANNMNHLR
jgi:hypothetical protein